MECSTLTMRNYGDMRIKRKVFGSVLVVHCGRLEGFQATAPYIQRGGQSGRTRPCSPTRWSWRLHDGS